MILDKGQIINDGENDLIVCATKEYEGLWYAYVLNNKTDEVGFYKVTDLGEDYDFELVEDEKKIKELVLLFGKDYIKENPNVISKVQQIIDLDKKDNQ